MTELFDLSGLEEEFVKLLPAAYVAACNKALAEGQDLPKAIEWLRQTEKRMEDGKL